MKNNSYNLNRDVLTIKTAFGNFKFKIEGTDLLDKTEQIVKLMLSEIDNVDRKLTFRKEKSGQYARLLLTNLNLCEKYIKLEEKYRALTDRLEEIDRKLQSATTPPDALQIDSRRQIIISQEINQKIDQEPAITNIYSLDNSVNSDNSDNNDKDKTPEDQKQPSSSEETAKDEKLISAVVTDPQSISKIVKNEPAEPQKEISSQQQVVLSDLKEESTYYNTQKSVIEHEEPEESKKKEESYNRSSINSGSINDGSTEKTIYNSDNQPNNGVTGKEINEVKDEIKNNETVEKKITGAAAEDHSPTVEPPEAEEIISFKPFVKERSAIANWKLSQSYLAMKKKALERVLMQKKSTSEADSADDKSSYSSQNNVKSGNVPQNENLPDEAKVEESLTEKPTEKISEKTSETISEKLSIDTEHTDNSSDNEKKPDISESHTGFLSGNEPEKSHIQEKSEIIELNNIINTNNRHEYIQLSRSSASDSPDENSRFYSEKNIEYQTDSLTDREETEYQLTGHMTGHKSEIKFYQTIDAESISTSQQQKTKTYKKGEYVLPNMSFLKNTSQKNEIDHQSIRRDAELLEKKLGHFGIKGEVMGVSPGPVITTFEYRPEPGIKISKIVNLADDLALALSAFSIRIVAPIPGKDVMGIEIPNIKKSLVPFIDIVSSEGFMKSRSKVPICLGKDIVGNPVVMELDRMPHLLIAGATGTGKSVGLNAMITSILYKSTPEEVRFLMIDPKRIELSFYNDIPHLLTPVITDMKKATLALQWLVREMDRRYSLLAKSQVRHIEQYNQKIASSTASDNGELEPLPFIVVIIDELADLMMTASKDIEFSLTRLAQMARAAGIHLILATQRPSVDVLTGIIKANFPTRISFQVSSKTDSRTIIDSNGAETLLGNGDMLFVPPGTARLTRVHGTYLSEDELLDITAFLKSQGKPEYVLDVITECDEEPVQVGTDDDYDDKYNEALEFVVATRQASISGIQRALRVGYNRAARIIDIMEKRGIVGPSDGVKPRRVIIENIEF